jgi:AMP-binding enzyme/phosphopantetheine binding protein
MAGLKFLDEVRRRSLQLDGGTDYSIPTLIQKHWVTHLQCTPSLARALMATSESREALCGIQKLMLGGEALPPPLIAELKTIVAGEIYNMYGPTETTVWSATSSIEGGGTDIHLGRPIANTEFYVLNRHLQPVPIGIPGELFIGGKGVARGYLNRSELTAERFIENPFPGTRSPRLYRTGDLVRYRPDGNLDFLGRADFQVKIRGHRIELGEIETALAQHPAVREAVVVAHEDASRGDKRLVAYVVPKGSGSEDGWASGGPSNEDLQKHLHQNLPDYMIPATFVFLNRLPLTPNGKVDRPSLYAPSSERPTLQGSFVGPRNDVEEKLCRIWESVLGIRQVGVKDDFFSLGGDSLSVIRVTVQAGEVLGQRPSIVAVVQARTVERLAMHLSASQTQETAGWSTQTPSSGQASDVVVRRMCEADLEEIIDIHVDRFPEWRVTILGRPFLRKMYRWFMENQGELTLVALHEGKLIGFTAGSVGGYKRSVLLKGLLQLVRGIVLNPLPLFSQSARRIVKRLGVMSGGPPVSAAVARPDVADNNIMALSRSSDRGGMELMLAFEEAARQKGIQPHFHEQSD